MIYNIGIKDDLKDALAPDDLNKSGCYILYLTDPSGPKTITRFKGADPNGILYIGKADYIGKRVRSLQDSVLSNCDNENETFVERGHKTLSRKYHRIRKFLEVDNLKIKIFVAPGFDARILESNLLEDYVSKYAELPPLNGQYGSYTLAESRALLDNYGFNLDNDS